MSAEYFANTAKLHAKCKHRISQRSTGNLTRRIQYVADNEIGEAIKAFHHLLSTQQDIVARVRRATETVSSSVSALEDNSRSVSNEVKRQQTLVGNVQHDFHNTAEQLAIVRTREEATGIAQKTVRRQYVLR